MRVSIDVAPLARQRPAGIENYLFQLCKHLPSAGDGLQFRLFASSWRHYNRLHTRVSELRAQNMAPALLRLPRGLLETSGRLFGWPRLEDLIGRVDLHHSIDSSPPRRRRARLVSTIYDLTPFLFPHFFSDEEIRRALIHRIESWVQQSDLLISISHATAADLTSLFPHTRGKIRVTHLAPDPAFRAPRKISQRRAILGRYRLNKPYLLSLGSRVRRKNLPILIQAYAALPAPLRGELLLTLAGRPGNADEQILAESDRLGVSEFVRLLDYVEADHLPTLLGEAEVFLFPSLYEGFGIPVLEAMACKTPVVASNRPSIPEVAGTAAWLVDPDRPEDFANAICSILEDSATKHLLIGRGLEQAAQFTWQKTARHTAAAYRSLADIHIDS